jgi:hypothetical protein
MAFGPFDPEKLKQIVSGAFGGRMDPDGTMRNPDGSPVPDTGPGGMTGRPFDGQLGYAPPPVSTTEPVEKPQPLPVTGGRGDITTMPMQPPPKGMFTDMPGPVDKSQGPQIPIGDIYKTIPGLDPSKGPVYGFNDPKPPVGMPSQPLTPPKMDPPSYGIPRRFMRSHQQPTPGGGGQGQTLIDLIRRSMGGGGQQGPVNAPMGSDGFPMVPNGWGGYMNKTDADRLYAAGGAT